MQLTFRPATPSDIPALGAIAFAAFKPSTLIQHISPTSDEAALAFWTQVAQAGLGSGPNTHLVVVEDNSQCPPVIVSFAKWTFVPEGAPLPGIFFSGGGGGGDEDENEAFWATMNNPEFAKEYFGNQAMQHARIVKERAHWYLELITTSPEFQGRGAGKMLMEWGLERVDETGFEAYLEASPEGKGLFEKFGFRVVDEAVYFEGGYVERYMVRRDESICWER
ncbi:acyl-CoA N-acyltransferase [Parachaetomium inaequale]|uniref:Acyl-CoA N-acyltransferase n=1 Tax=Parachaetomium inaequale TaxID=2588326 RepID=A0AAN6P7E7_9PEZI|nr:acyl-CoA N-acyltransferase [Parachaetomium inaequale]